MDLAFSKEEVAFRDEVRAFFRDNVPPATRQKLQEGRHLSKDEMITWWRILNKKGWGVSHWPKEYGGTGWTSVQHYIFNEELQMAPAPAPLAFGVSMVGPVIYTFGNEEQKKQYLPRIANVDDWWCQGFSEPGSGSDLASLKTKAERKGDKYIVNGQKTWTTLAQHADMIFCLCRTDPSAKKQIRHLLHRVPMKSKGITVRPIQTIDGGHEVNEVFFDDVEVPVENLIGEENKGWDYAKFLLGNERTGIARVGVSKERIRRIKELASKVESGGKPVLEDQGFREKLAAVEIELKALELTQLRVVADEGKHGKGKPNPASSVLKIKGSEIQQATTELLMEVIGPFAAPFDEHGDDGSQRGDGLDRADRAELFQQPQGLDLRRLQRDPAQHHHQGGAGALRRERAATHTVVMAGLDAGASTSSQLRGKTWMPATSAGMTERIRNCRERVENMDFDLSEEQRLLKESVDGLLGDAYDFDQRKKYMAEKGGWSKAFWGKLAEQGLLGLPFSEDDGGFGAGGVETMIVMEALGKALVLEPYLATVVLGGGFLRHGARPSRRPRTCPASSTAARPLPSRSSRRIRATIWPTSSTSAKKKGAGWVIDGEKFVVLNGEAADMLVVTARTKGGQRDKTGIGVFLVPGNAKGVVKERLSDPGRPACRRHHLYRRRGRRRRRDRRSRKWPCR